MSGQLKVSVNKSLSYSSVRGSVTTTFQSPQHSSPSQCLTPASLTKAATAVMPTKDVNVTPSSPSSSSSPHFSGKWSSSGYSAGSMAGLAIAMLTVGVVSGCAVMFLL